MAETSTNTKKRTIRKAETVRERAEKASVPRKPRKIHRAVGIASVPVKRAGKLVSKAASPFSFILKPFKTRPMRFVGRILSKVLLLSYFRDSWAELRQVTWPTRRETWKLSLAVFIFSLIFGLTIALVDYGLDKIFRALLLQ